MTPKEAFEIAATIAEKEANRIGRLAEREHKVWMDAAHHDFSAYEELKMQASAVQGVANEIRRRAKQLDKRVA